MNKHQIKINKASKLVEFLPMAEREIMSDISPILIERLTAAELAEVKRCLYRHWHKAVSHTERAIINEGCIWSQQHNQLLELVTPNEIN